MTKRKYDYLVMDPVTGGFLCNRCKRSMKLPLPISIDMFGVMAKQFIKEHKLCQATLLEILTKNDGHEENTVKS